MSALVPVCSHDKAYPCEFCLEGCITALERQLAEAQDELNAWRLEFTTTLDDGLPYQMDALEAGKMLEDAEAEARMAKQDLDEGK